MDAAPTQRHQQQSQMVGREGELATLVEAILGDAWVVVVGEAGIGKTALIRAAVVATRRPVHEGGAFATLSWVPYLPLRRALGPPIDGDAPDVADRVEAAIGPDLLVLDDLHWADPQTLAVLPYLAGRTQLISAVRQEAPGAQAVLDLLGRLGARRVELGGLDDEAARAIVRRDRPNIEAEALAATVRAAGGNPLLLEELGRAGETVNVLGRGLERRRQQLSPPARQSLDLLAIVDRSLPREGLDGVQELLDAGLVRERGGDLEIRHALLAEGIRESLDAASVRHLHRQAARLCPDPAEQARHLVAAGARAAAVRIARAALAETTELQRRMPLSRTIAEVTGRPDDLVPALADLADLGEFAAVVQMTDTLPPLGSPSALQAAWHRAAALSRVGRPAESWSLATSLLDSLDDRGVEVAARLVILVAVLHVNHRGDAPAAVALLERELAAAPGGPLRRLGAEFLLETARMYTGERPDLARMRAAVEASITTRDGAAIARAVNLQKMIRVLEGPGPALRAALAMHALLDGFGAAAADLAAEAAGAAVLAGRFREALRIAEEVLDRPAPLRARLHAVVRAAESLGALGHHDLAARQLAAADAIPGDLGDASERLITRMSLAHWSGRSLEASALADELLRHGTTTDVNLALPMMMAAWADHDLGRSPRAVPRFDLPVLRGLAAESAGLEAWATGDLDAAAVAFDAAARLHEGMLPPDAAMCCWAAGETRRLAGHADAVDVLRAAQVAAGALEFEPVLARVRRSLRQAGVRNSARRGTRTPLGLTAREAAIVDLVGQGLSNVEIARRLGLGRPTIARMVASAMGKLGAARRAELAAAAPA